MHQMRKLMKPKKCKSCKNEYQPVYKLQTCCSVGCAIQYTKERSKITERKKWAMEKKEIKEKIKTASDYRKELQTVINSIVRLIDKGCGCICTGAKTGKQNAGHYLPVGAFPAVRFNLHNVHLQSEHSNTYKHGDIHNYQFGIIKTYGEDYLELMNSLKKYPPLNLSKFELKEKIKICREIEKDLKKEDKEYSAEERMELRELLNKKINIYNS